MKTQQRPQHQVVAKKTKCVFSCISPLQLVPIVGIFLLPVLLNIEVVTAAGWLSPPNLLTRATKAAAVAAFVNGGYDSTTANSSWKTAKFSSSRLNSEASPAVSSSSTMSEDEIFQDFCDFLLSQQKEIIDQIENIDGSGQHFCEDTWGRYSDDDVSSTTTKTSSGGITRVIQGGDVVEKGACSFTLIDKGILTSERAATIQARQTQEQQQEQGMSIQAGDTYSAAALSMVLHTRSPLIPTFRSDVRIFMVRPSSLSSNRQSIAWFGGGADLTPYYLFDKDITSFHLLYKKLCDEQHNEVADYETMKKACDEYFYLPARVEHRGTGGIFFDDMNADVKSLEFVKDVVRSWMPSWFPIINERRSIEYTKEQKHWQKLRRGRYLEFNLLYDRGVKFGLMNANPRVEGVMVSAPPEIAFDYKHTVQEGSPEEKLLQVLKKTKEWA